MKNMTEETTRQQLDRMIDAVSKATEGDSDVRIEVPQGNDRLSALARGINRLIDTMQKQAENLRRSEQRYRQVVEAMNEAVGVADSGGELIFVNRRFCELLGVKAEDIVGRRFIDLLDEANRVRWLSQQKRRKQGLSSAYELELTRADGKKIYCVASGAPLRDDHGNYICSIGVLTDITERRLREEALRMFRFSVDHAPDAVYWVNGRGEFDYVNHQACRALGYTRKEFSSLHLWEIDPLFSEARWRDWWGKFRKDGELDTRHHETLHRRKDGTVFPVEISSSHFWLGGREFHVAFARDITARKRMEEQLIHSRKMEAVGQLAGGVAHDFNNMLSVILGYSELIRSRLMPDDPLDREIGEIEKAAARSRDITRQLLAFSRKQIISPRILDLNRQIEGTLNTLFRLIGENIELRFFPGKDLAKIRFDPSQIDQILVNLAVNARDAMPAGGKLTIETANIHIDEEYCRTHLQIEAGSYVLLTVSDNGAGIDRDALPHVFEPFFTTKGVDKGTGLGLATVYGIIQQNRGGITVHSEPGKGATFKICIPSVPPSGGSEDLAADEAKAASSMGRVLLVEDDEMVRTIAKAMLERLGCTVVATRSPDEALAFCAGAETRVDLLLTDVVMPEMSGVELRDRIRTLQPNIKVLFMSGYSSNVIADHGILEEGVHFVQKPFSMNALAKKVRDAMQGD